MAPTLPFHRILVPVDFSPASRRALELALVLADQFKAEIEVVHVWGVPNYLRPDLTVWSGDASRLLSEHIREEAVGAMKKLLGETGAAERQGVSSKLLLGEPYPTILHAAEHSSADLIVMGTHGRKGLAHAMLGSIAEKIVQLAKVPVLTTRAPE